LSVVIILSVIITLLGVTTSNVAAATDTSPDDSRGLLTSCSFLQGL